MYREATLLLSLLTLVAYSGASKTAANCADETWPNVDGDGRLPIGALNDCEFIPEILNSYAEDGDGGDASTHPGAEEVAGDRVSLDCDRLDEPTVMVNHHAQPQKV